jgi:hypothetical protein
MPGKKENGKGRLSAPHPIQWQVVLKQSAVPGLLAIRLYWTDTLNSEYQPAEENRNTPTVMKTFFQKYRFRGLANWFMN